MDLMEIYTDCLPRGLEPPHLLHQGTERGHHQFILCESRLLTMTQSFLWTGKHRTVIAAQFLTHSDALSGGNYPLGSQCVEYF